MRTSLRLVAHRKVTFISESYWVFHFPQNLQELNSAFKKNRINVNTRCQGSQRAK
jgi:hypothetical protein